MQAVVPTLTEFITVRFIDVSCHTGFASAGKPNTRFNNDSDKVQFRESHLHGASQQVVPAFSRPEFFTSVSTLS